MTESRKSSRSRSFLSGRITFNNRRNILDCVVRDVSAEGARLVLSDAITTPDVFDLFIPQKEQTLRACVVWRRGPEIGVAFNRAEASAAPVKPSASAELSDRVHRLESEIAALKRILRQIKADAMKEFDAN